MTKCAFPSYVNDETGILGALEKKVLETAQYVFLSQCFKKVFKKMINEEDILHLKEILTRFCYYYKWKTWCKLLSFSVLKISFWGTKYCALNQFCSTWV